MTPHTEIFNDLLKLAVESGASDIVIKSNKPGYVRLSGRLKPVDMDPISSPEAEASWTSMCRAFSSRMGGGRAGRLRLFAPTDRALPRQRVSTSAGS
jgi:Tfp pilus assembly ATPase PilU